MLALLTACLVAMLAASCGTATSGSPEGTWTGREDTVLELTADGSVTGHDGCYYLGGSWDHDGDSMVVYNSDGTELVELLGSHRTNATVPATYP